MPDFRTLLPRLSPEPGPDGPAMRHRPRCPEIRVVENRVIENRVPESRRP